MLRYAAVWGALVVLTVTTWAVSRLDLGAFHLPVALLIACAKSALVVVFFMHLWQHGGVNRLVLLTALVFLLLLMGFTLADLATRFPPSLPPGPWRG